MRSDGSTGPRAPSSGVSRLVGAFHRRVHGLARLNPEGSETSISGPSLISALDPPNPQAAHSFPQLASLPLDPLGHTRGPEVDPIRRANRDYYDG